MADLDFDELHKNITTQMNGDSENSPYSERRKSTRRSVEHSSRRDSTRDEVAINVKVNKKSEIKPVADNTEAGTFIAPAPQPPAIEVKEDQAHMAEDAMHDIDDAFEATDTAFSSPEGGNVISHELDHAVVGQESYIPPHDQQSMAELTGIDPINEELTVEDYSQQSDIEAFEDNPVDPDSNLLGQVDGGTSSDVGIDSVQENSIDRDSITPINQDAGAFESLEKPQINEPKQQRLKLWDILYYIIVCLLVLVIIALIFVLLDRFEVIDLPDSLPLIGLLI